MSCWALGAVLGPAVGGYLADPCGSATGLQHTALCAGSTSLLRRAPFLVPFALLAGAAAAAGLACVEGLQPGHVILAACRAVEGRDHGAEAESQVGPSGLLSQSQEGRSEHCTAQPGGRLGKVAPDAGSSEGVCSDAVATPDHAASSRQEQRTSFAARSTSGSDIEMTPTAARLHAQRSAASAAAAEAALLEEDDACRGGGSLGAGARWSGHWWTHRCVHLRPQPDACPEAFCGPLVRSTDVGSCQRPARCSCRRGIQGSDHE
jgi:hypothetical protein